MWAWFVVGVIALLVVDRLMLAAERRGWVYYRRKPSSGSMSAAAFGAMADLMQPGRQVVVAQEHHQRGRKAESRAGEDQ